MCMCSVMNKWTRAARRMLSNTSHTAAAARSRRHTRGEQNYIRTLLHEDGTHAHLMSTQLGLCSNYKSEYLLLKQPPKLSCSSLSHSSSVSSFHLHPPKRVFHWLSAAARTYWRQGFNNMTHTMGLSPQWAGSPITPKEKGEGEVERIKPTRLQAGCLPFTSQQTKLEKSNMLYIVLFYQCI